MTSVEAKLIEKNYGKPPLMVLKLELTLKNGDDEPRWFLVPRKLPAGIEKGVNGVEVRAFEGKGRAVVGRFTGTAGFHALLLPAKAEVTLRGLTLDYWGKLPDTIHFEVRVARDVLVGGEPARAWFAADPTSDVSVDAEKEKGVSVKRTPDAKEVPVSAVDARAIPVELRLRLPN